MNLLLSNFSLIALYLQIRRIVSWVVLTRSNTCTYPHYTGMRNSIESSMLPMFPTNNFIVQKKTIILPRVAIQSNTVCLF